MEDGVAGCTDNTLLLHLLLRLLLPRCLGLGCQPFNPYHGFTLFHGSPGLFKTKTTPKQPKRLCFTWLQDSCHNFRIDLGFLGISINSPRD